MRQPRSSPSPKTLDSSAKPAETKKISKSRKPTAKADDYAENMELPLTTEIRPLTPPPSPLLESPPNPVHTNIDPVPVVLKSAGRTTKSKAKVAEPIAPIPPTELIPASEAPPEEKKPRGRKPTSATSVTLDPVQAEVAKPAPVQAEVAKPAPVQAEVAKPAPVQAEVAKPAPVQAEVAKPAPVQAEVAKPAPVQAEVAKPAPVQAEVAQVEVEPKAARPKRTSRTKAVEYVVFEPQTPPAIAPTPAPIAPAPAPAPVVQAPAPIAPAPVAPVLQPPTPAPVAIPVAREPAAPSVVVENVSAPVITPAPVVAAKPVVPAPVQPIAIPVVPVEATAPIIVETAPSPAPTSPAPAVVSTAETVGAVVTEPARTESSVAAPAPQQTGQPHPQPHHAQQTNGQQGNRHQQHQHHNQQGGQHGNPQQGGQQGFERGGRFKDRWGRRRGKNFRNNYDGPPENGPDNGNGNNRGNQAPVQPPVPVEPAVPLPPGPHLDINAIQAKGPRALKDFAKENSIENPTSFKRHDLICEIIKRNGAKNGSASSGGVLELDREGFGFLRSPTCNFQACPEDLYVSVAQVRRHNLRRGELISGAVKVPRDKERYFALARLDQIEGKVAEEGRVRPAFDSLTATFPNRRIFLEGSKGDVSMRAMDLICPLGFGQRGLIVAPPRTGKTILLQKIANAVMENNPKAHLIMLLIDERPEEVTDMLRTVKGDVLASTFDETPDRHIHVAELVMERAKRLVENKVDVVILMDSITRLTRAYNAMEGSSGKIGTGGIVPNALQRAKRLFGIARNCQEGGSLTIIATALVDTGSRMDDIIFEEFKGTGNMEVNLDRNLSDQRVFPAFNIQRSGTRKEELLYHPDELARIHALRRVLSEESPVEAMGLLLEKINKTQNNIEFLMSLKPTA